MNSRLLWVCVLAAWTGVPDRLDAQAQFASRSTGQPVEEYRPVAVMLRAGALPAALAGTVSVRAQAEPLERILEQIAAQANLGISYGPDVVQSRTLVTLDVRRKSAAHALASLERGTQWTVLATPSGRVTLLRREPPRVQQQGSISGRVMDATTQQPLAGAAVAVMGTRFGATTDEAGRYTITGVPNGGQRVQASRVGYAAQEK